MKCGTKKMKTGGMAKKKCGPMKKKGYKMGGMAKKSGKNCGMARKKR